MKRKTLADGFKGITGIETSLPYQEKDIMGTLLAASPITGKIEFIDQHFICTLGCKKYIRHSPDQVGKLVEALLEKFLSKKPEEEEE